LTPAPTAAIKESCPKGASKSRGACPSAVAAGTTRTKQARRTVPRKEIQVKLTKILGLAAVAAVAVMAFAGSASATRLHPLIRLCLKAELLLCSEANSLELKGTLKGLQVGTGTLEGTLNQKCTGGEIRGKLNAAPGNMVEILKKNEKGEEVVETEESQLLGEITTLTFSGCEPCTKITSTGGFATKIRHPTEGAEAEKLWFLQGGGNAIFEKCPFGINCKFGSASLKPEPYIEMATGFINTNKAELKLEEGSAFFCGSTGNWNAKYEIDLDLETSPTNVVHKNIWPTLCKKGAEKCIS
jgi:hypothetical protein